MQGYLWQEPRANLHALSRKGMCNKEIFEGVQATIIVLNAAIITLNDRLLLKWAASTY